MKLRGILKRALVGNHNLSDYIAVGVPEQVTEPTVWCFVDQRVQVTASCMLYDPAMIGLCFEEGEPEVFPSEGEFSHLEYMDEANQNCLGRVSLIHEHTFELLNNRLYLFAASEGNLFLNSLKQRLISRIIHEKLRKEHRSFLSTFSPDIYRTLSVIFTHPRLTRLLSVQGSEQKELTFPVDLYTVVDQAVFLGLRNSNRGTEYLVKGAQFCLSDIRTQHRPAIYSLGKFGGKAPDDMKLAETELLKLHIPDVFHSYIEVELKEVIPYEYQTIYRCEILNRVTRNSDESGLLLAHLQLLRYLKAPMKYEHQVV